IGAKAPVVAVQLPAVDDESVALRAHAVAAVVADDAVNQLRIVAQDDARADIPLHIAVDEMFIVHRVSGTAVVLAATGVGVSMPELEPDEIEMACVDVTVRSRRSRLINRPPAVGVFQRV